MASIPVTIHGTLTFSDRDLGGGPMPGGPGGQPGQPPKPWGPINYPDQGLPGNQPYPDQSLPGEQPKPWGPINYPDQGLPGQPPQIWGGGNQPFPTNPIVIPLPPQTGGEGDKPVISHPIVIPPNIIIVPPNPSENKPPPETGGWGYSTDYGWGYFPGPGQAGPKEQKPPAPQQQQGQPAKK